MEFMENLEKRLEDLEKRVEKAEKGIGDIFQHLVKILKTDIEFHKKFELLAAIAERTDKMIKVSTATILWIAHRLGSK